MHPESDARPPAPEARADAERPALALVLALLPALAAIWLVPGFATQDGPAHLYNAQILLDRAVDPASPLADAYEVKLDPVPNLAGHLLLAGLLAAMPAWAADKAATTLPLVGFAASVLWLRVRVAGREGSTAAALLAAMLGLNVVWLFGFTNFLLGACLFPIALGIWWGGRDGAGPGRALALATLLVLGYACHLVALGLAIVGLVVLEALTPCRGPAGARRARALWTAAALAPMVPLGLVYRNLARGGGPLRPEWDHLASPFSPSAWAAQLGWADPISLGSKVILPFVGGTSKFHALLAPAAWLAAGLALLAVAGLRSGSEGRRERRGWAALAALLVLGGVAGPDSLGVSHGHYLPQRVFLLGLAAAVPCLGLAAEGRLRRAGVAAVAAALAVQSAFVWDYALESDRTAGAIAGAADAVGTNRRVATLLVDIRGRYRANPRLHADNWLGVGTGNVVWNNYETAHYYFPVRFRPGLDRPTAAEFERVAVTDRDPEARAALWSDLMARHADAVDVLVVWGSDPRLDALNARWFDPVAARGPVRVLRRKGGPGPAYASTGPRAGRG